MKFRHLMLALLVPAIICCQKAETPGEDDKNENPGNENVTPDSGSSATELAPEVKNGETILVTNPSVEKFLTDVKYETHSYIKSDLPDWAAENNVAVSPGKNTDKPQSYTIRWAKSDAENVTLTLTEGDWNRVYTNIKEENGVSYVEITNLCPNATYTYKVATGETVLTEGSFNTTGKVRQLFFRPLMRNFRDLGGWTTEDGKTVKYRKIYRAGRPEYISALGIEDFKAEGIKAQLDLRNTEDVLSEEECTVKKYYEDYEFCAPLIREGYVWLLRDDQEKARQCIQFVIDCVNKGKPVFYHCSLGRDRTGTITLILLGLLGVPDGDISQEYELTQFAPFGYSVSSGESTQMTRMADFDGGALYFWDNYVESGETFADGVEKYLLSIGISQADIDTFRENMLE